MDNKELDSTLGILETEKEILGRELPKWPGFIVTGKPLSKDLAKEVMIRTTSFNFSTNDYDFANKLYQSIGIVIPSGKSGYDVQYDDSVAEQIKEAYASINSIVPQLDYCENSQVLSAWIGGPKGWLAWNGRIGTNCYNIGKYPSCEEVYREWKLIAETFPQIELKCQILNHETGEEERELKPVIQYNIKDGEVRVISPTEMIDYPSDPSFNIFGFGRERGCTVEDFVEAFNLAKNVK